MTVAELIERLRALPADSRVVQWDDESQVVVGLGALVASGIGVEGGELVSEGGEPTVLLMHEAQSIEAILGDIEQNRQLLAALEEDPTLIHGKHSMGIKRDPE